MQKTILITGLNGQLGQHLAKFFQEKHPEFKLIGTIRQKSYDNQPKIFDETSVEKETLDLADSASIETIVSKYKPDYIFNTAALAHVGESWHAPLAYAQFDGVAVIHFLEAIRKHSPHSRFLNLGTSEEIERISSPYAAAKNYARHMIDLYRSSYNLYAIQPWVFNFESKLRGEKYVTRKITKGVARINRAIQNKESFEPIQLGNLNAYRSWQHAEDVAEGLWLIVNQIGEPKDWKPYILSGDDIHAIREFIEKAFSIVGIYGSWAGSEAEEKYIIDNHLNEIGEIKSQVLVSVSADFFRPLDVSCIYGDSSKARKELGWTPKHSFDDLLQEMIENDLKSS